MVQNKANRRLARYFEHGRKPVTAVDSHGPRRRPCIRRLELAVLQTDWLARAQRLTVDYGGGAVRLELDVAGESLLRGAWEFEVAIGDQPLTPKTEWRWSLLGQRCGLRLSRNRTEELTGGFRIQRQMPDPWHATINCCFYLTRCWPTKPKRKCNPVWRCRSRRSHALSYRGRVPLAAGILPSPAANTWEVLLQAENADAGTAVGFAGMAQRHAWRVAPRRLDRARTATANAGRADVHAAVDRLIGSSSASKPFTWRQLTVAEQRENVTCDVAVGYRVQFAKRQWLVYRSLTAPANRTVLGQNLSTEFFGSLVSAVTAKPRVLLEIE